jgi:hypothetical protein
MGYDEGEYRVHAVKKLRQDSFVFLVELDQFDACFVGFELIPEDLISFLMTLQGYVDARDLTEQVNTAILRVSFPMTASMIPRPTSYDGYFSRRVDRAIARTIDMSQWPDQLTSSTSCQDYSDYRVNYCKEI